MQSKTILKSSLWSAIKCNQRIVHCPILLINQAVNEELSVGVPILRVRLIMNPLNLHGEHFLLLLSCIRGSLLIIQIRHLLVTKSTGKSSEPANLGRTGLFMTDLLPNVYSNMKSVSDRQTCLITRFIKPTILRLWCFPGTVCALDAIKVNSALMGKLQLIEIELVMDFSMIFSQAWIFIIFVTVQLN